MVGRANEQRELLAALSRDEAQLIAAYEAYPFLMRTLPSCT